MTGNEPINLRERRSHATLTSGGRLFTCGRPGRGTFGRKRFRIDDTIVHLWVQGLPVRYLVMIVSLLGTKRDGYSEFAYYSFRSSKESGEKPTFQEWLDQHYSQRFVVNEFPTIDSSGIPSDVLSAVSRCMLHLVEEGHTVVLVDSAGAERTSRVCEAIDCT
jgi:hypothetical protein